MKPVCGVRHCWQRCLLGSAAGLLFTTAFPLIGISSGAWIAPALLFLCVAGLSGKESFRIGYIAGLVQWLSTLYWLLLIPVAWYPVLGWVALSAYLALYTGAWTWLAVRLAPVQVGATDSAYAGLSVLRMQLSARPARLVVGWTIACAAGWVALEMLRARLLTGFPWLPLGASQFKLTPLIQVAAVTGVYGVSFFVVWASLSVLVALGMASTGKWRAALVHGVLPGIVVGGVVCWGYARLGTAQEADRYIRLALVQPSIPQTMIWDPKENATRFAKLIELSETALAADKPDVLIWPEAALPSFDETSYAAITNLVVKHRVWMISGADEVEARRASAREPEYDYYNSAILVSPAGQFVDSYRKRHLVMFGEYIPLSRALPFLRHFTPIQAGFTPGREPVQFELEDVGAKVSTLICFEDIFPGLARKSVNNDTDFLLNLTNNGWFRESAAQWQHAITALFRAVENGIPLVRCSNNGLTCWVDRYGRIKQIFWDGAGTIYGPGVMTVQLPVPGAGGTQLSTFYRAYGDVFGWACTAAIVAALSTRRFARTQHRSSAR